jgi:hypothetical protein
VSMATSPIARLILSYVMTLNLLVLHHCLMGLLALVSVATDLNGQVLPSHSCMQTKLPRSYTCMHLGQHQTCTSCITSHWWLECKAFKEAQQTEKRLTRRVHR